MKRSLRAGDSGLAAIEFALVYLLILSLLAMCIPLVVALQERVRLERVAGHTARFATAAPDRPRFGAENRRPSPFEVRAEAYRAYALVGDPNRSVDLGTVEYVVDKDPRTVPPGDRITIRLKQEVHLGPVGTLLDIIGVVTSPNIIMEVVAVGRQE